MIIVPKSFCEEVISDNGSENEKFVLIEELAELTKEITKELRAKGKIENITEEVGDCYICLETIKKIYEIRDSEVQRSIDSKVKRYNRRKLEGDTR